MNRFRILSALLLLTCPLFAQESQQENKEVNANRAYKNKVFQVQNRNPNDLGSAIKLLGSGFPGTGLSVNMELRTITVRDFPENIATIEEALQRLDRVEVTPSITLDIAVLIGSKTQLPNAPHIPADLAPVVKEMQSTLRYTSYGLLTATMHRTKPGGGVENSGVAEPGLIGMVAKENRPIIYSYSVRQISTRDNMLSVERFQFDMRIPIDTGSNGIQYQNVGFNTPLSIRQNEKVVIGTTTMGDKALIVVVTARVEAP